MHDRSFNLPFLLKKTFSSVFESMGVSVMSTRPPISIYLTISVLRAFRARNMLAYTSQFTWTQVHGMRHLA